MTGRLSSLVRRTIIVAIIAAGGLLGPPGKARAPGPRLETTDCLVDGAWARDVRRECGWLVVPESRDRRGKRVVRLAVEIFRAREPTGEPPRVFLHGGPGGAGAIRMYSEGFARNRLSLHRDIVLYDQRGAGLSEPKLCPAYDDASDAAMPDARRACLEELAAQGVDREAYSTAASVADLIDLRRALGYARWDVYGVSYGARLAQEAMARDGGGIRAVVLASPVARSFSSQAEQPFSTQHALEHVFAACAGQASCREAFPDVEANFYALYDELTSSPLSIPIPRADGAAETIRFDGKRLVSGIRDLLLHRLKAGLPRLPLLLHELRSGDRTRAARELVQGDSGGGSDRALRTLVNCADRATFGAAYRETLDAANAAARPPFRRVADDECREWLPHLRDRPMPGPVQSAIPTLLLTGAFDDRTPTTQAARIAATLRQAYVVEFPDEGHDTRPGPCHSAVIEQFLQDPGRRPDTSCVATIPALVFATTWEQDTKHGP